MTDQDMPRLEGLHNLVGGRQITDAAIPALKKLSRLRFLSLVNSSVSGPGKQQLFDAMPSFEAKQRTALFS